MVLYEIWSLGHKPFEELGPIEVTKKQINSFLKATFHR